MTYAERLPDKPKVFISYSRDDLGFADQLVAALSLHNFTTLLDRQGISGGEDWKQRLGLLVRDADTVVFVLSPASALSKICAWEVEESARLGKRIIPIVCRPLEGSAPPPQLSRLDYIFFCNEPRSPASGFGTGLKRLVEALNTDIDWRREHTRLLQRASEWKAAPSVSRLLFGDAIGEVKAWMQRRPLNAPEPTDLQYEFIRVSEEAEVERLSERRRNLEAMAAALAVAEEAQKRETAQARRLARRTAVGFIGALALTVVAVGTGYLAWTLNREAETQRWEAETQRREAARQASESRVYAGKAELMQLKALRNNLGARTQQAKTKQTREEMDAVMWGVLEFLRSPAKAGQTRDIAGLLSWLDKEEKNAKTSGRSRSLAAVLVPLFVRALGDADEERRDIASLAKLKSFSSPEAVRIVNCFIVKNTRRRTEKDPELERKVAEYEKERKAILSESRLKNAEKEPAITLPLDDGDLDAGCSESSTPAVAQPGKPRDRKNFRIPPAIQDKHPALVDLILGTESMDDEERQYWFDIMPSIEDGQIARLFDILETERRQLAELEVRYQEEIKPLNEKLLVEWNAVAAKLGDPEALLQQEIISAREHASRETAAAAIPKLEKAIAAVPVNADSAKTIIKALDFIARLDEESLPLSDLIGARLGAVGSFNFAATLKIEERRESVLAKKVAVAKAAALISDLRKYREEWISMLETKGQYVEAANQAQELIRDLDQLIGAKASDTNLCVAYYWRAQARGLLSKILEKINHLPARHNFPDDDDIAKAILADSLSSFADADPEAPKDGNELDAANNLIWKAATDHVFLEHVDRSAVDEVVEKSTARVDKQLNLLDTVAVYYCATGRGEKAVAVYKDILDRLKKRPLSSNETDVPPGYQWERAALAIKDCADGKIDSRTHAWEQYQ